MAEEYHSVVIVGAGITGLYASRILSKVFKDVLIVEAQGRTGGRIKDLKGHAPWPIQVGPEFVHGATSELVDLIDELGFGYTEKPWPDWWYFGREKRLIHDSVGDEDVAKVHEMFSNVEYEASPAPREPDVSARQWMLQRGANSKMVAVADACYANDFGCSIDQLGLREMIQENRGWDSGETYLILDRSMVHVAEALAKSANIRHNWPVKHIQYTSSGALLQGPNGQTIRCSKVIVTVPLPILQKDLIRFTPPMPPAKRAALQRLKMGNAVKVICSFSRRFWPSDMYDVICSDCFAPEFWMTQYPTTDPPNANLHACVAFIAGERADAVGRRPDADNVRDFVAQLDEIFGTDSDPKPASDSLVKGVVMDWAKEEYVQGAYTYPTVGAELGDRDLLAAPMANTVFFAGEATHPAINPCIQASMETGRRAAMQVVMALRPVPSKL